MHWPVQNISNIHWVFLKDFRSNPFRILHGPSLSSQAHLLGVKGIKSILSELWFEQNQNICEDKSKSQTEHFDISLILLVTFLLITVPLFALHRLLSVCLGSFNFLLLLWELNTFSFSSSSLKHHEYVSCAQIKK